MYVCVGCVVMLYVGMFLGLCMDVFMFVCYVCDMCYCVYVYSYHRCNR